MADTEAENSILETDQNPECTIDEHLTVLQVYLSDLAKAKSEKSLERIQHRNALVKAKIDTIESLAYSEFAEKLTHDFTEKVSKTLGEASKQVEETQNIIDMVVSFGKKETPSGVPTPSTSSAVVKWQWTPLPFHGKPHEWTTWWDLFRSAIHESQDLKPEYKMKALTDCLKGQADEVLGNMARTGENYDQAIELLKVRYGNPITLSTAYYTQLKDIPAASGLKNERRTLDQLAAVVRNLNSLSSAIKIDEHTVMKGVISKFPIDLMRSTIKDLRHRTKSMKFTPKMVVEALDDDLQVEDFLAAYYEPSAPSSSSTESKATGVLNAGAVKRKAPDDAKCVFCDNFHKSVECRKFSTLPARLQQLRTLRKCANCLKPNHEAARCRNSLAQCKHCMKGHNSVLCMITKKRKGMLITYSSSFLQTFVCEILHGDKKNSSEVRGLLDPGSSCSYIARDLVKTLKLPLGTSINFECSRFNDPNSVSMMSNEVDVCLRNQHNQKRKLRLNTTLCITGELYTAPAPDICSKIMPPEYDYADYDILQDKQRPIKLLIGADLYFSLVDIEQHKELTCGVTLLHSFFGWVPAGGVRSNSSPPHKKFCSSMITSRLNTLKDTNDSSNEDDSSNPSSQPASDVELMLDDKIERMWSLETMGIENPDKQDSSEYVVNYYNKTTFIEPSGRKNVRIPWRNLKSGLLSNFRVALARLRHLLNTTDKDVLVQGDEHLHQQLELGITEFAPPITKSTRAYNSDEPHRLHYLPQRWIFQKGKLRVVNDAAAKTKSGLSLNNHIFPGPNLTENLVKLLLNFRMHSIGIVADIEKAYLQISLNEVDRDATRFLWVKDINKPATNENLLYLRYARVPFGLNVSPCLLNMTLQDTFGSKPTNKWLLQAQNKFYVDNYVNSVSSPADALELFDALTTRLDSIKMNLRDWATNDASIASALPADRLEKNAGIISVLGLLWCRKSDQLSVKLNEDCSLVATKKNVLSFLASIYDPLGLIAPCILELKLLVQKCWKIKYKWNALLPPQLASEWMKLHNDALQIPSLQLSRRYWTFEGPAESYSLHIFCDASQKAYACCAYLVHIHKGRSEYASRLIFTKTRIAPMKQLTIPKLELTAVVLGARVSTFLKKHLEIELASVTLWTDATTVLQWVTSLEVLPDYMNRRVTELRKMNCFLNYVPTADNPADLATRGTNASAIKNNNLWWNGPTWLVHERLWPKPPLNVENCKLPLNIRLCTIMVAPSTISNALLHEGIEKNLGSWDKRVRTFYLVLKFCFLRSNLPFHASEVEAMNLAERLLFIELQRKYFAREYEILKKGLSPAGLSPLNNLDLFLDESKIIRCRGRLHYARFPWETTHPILLPRESPATISYIQKIHCENAHCGASHTLAKLRERVWITKARTMVKSVIHRCFQCRYWEGGNYALPPIPPLPEVRLREVVPFIQVGIDYFGPLHIKDPLDPTGSNTVDAHVLLFTCLVTRAVHLELVPNLAGEQFIWALERFCSIRRVPKVIISDNYSTFEFVQPFVGIKVQIKDHKIKSFLNSNRIEWHFIPKYAPWYGGAYERLVGLVKRSLKKCYGKRLLSYIALQTVIYKIADIVNGRPLSYISSEEIVEPLTPNHFLKLGSTNINLTLEPVPKPMASNTGAQLLRNWQTLSGILDGYWDAFRHLYLLSLRERHTVQHPKKKGESPFRPSVGDVVLIQETTMPRGYWKVGTIEKLDARQAIAYVRSNRALLIRSIRQLYPLEVTVEKIPVPTSKTKVSAADSQPQPSTSTA